MYLILYPERSPSTKECIIYFPLGLFSNTPQGVYQILPQGSVSDNLPREWIKNQLEIVSNTLPGECINYCPQGVDKLSTVGVYWILSLGIGLDNSIKDCFKYSLWGAYQILSLGSEQILSLESVSNTLAWKNIRKYYVYFLIHSLVARMHWKIFSLLIRFLMSSPQLRNIRIYTIRRKHWRC